MFKITDNDYKLLVNGLRHSGHTEEVRRAADRFKRLSLKYDVLQAKHNCTKDALWDADAALHEGQETIGDI